jgi:hypothetical protein
MAILPKAFYRFNAMPIKILTHLFIELERAICKIHWNLKKIRITKTILNNKRTFGEISIPDLKLYYTAIVIKLHGDCTEIGREINGIEWKSQK